MYNIARGGILGVGYLPDTGHFSKGDNELLQSSLLCPVVVYVAQPTMAALKFFIAVVTLLLCASLGAGYNCTRRYHRLLREAATVKAQCPNAAFHDCCQVGQITFCVLFKYHEGLLGRVGNCGSLQPLTSSELTVISNWYILSEKSVLQWQLHFW